MYRSMIKSQGLSSAVGQLVVSLFGALHMLSQLPPQDNSEGAAPFVSRMKVGGSWTWQYFAG